MDLKFILVDKYVNQEDTDIEIFKYEDVKDKTKNLLISTYHDYFKNLDLNNKKVVVVGYK